MSNRYRWRNRGRKTFAELRALYARSRFVVVPLLPSDIDNGITSILEAFAMGKAVICTETAGQIGVLEHGVNCLRVPPFDVEASGKRSWRYGTTRKCASGLAPRDANSSKPGIATNNG